MTYAAVFSALANPTRRHIFEALREQPKSVGELAKDQSVSRPAVSQHLRYLRLPSWSASNRKEIVACISSSATGSMTYANTSRVSGPMLCLPMALRSRDA